MSYLIISILILPGKQRLKENYFNPSFNLAPPPLPEGISLVNQAKEGMKSYKKIGREIWS
jgi:hypothetical protein